MWRDCLPSVSVVTPLRRLGRRESVSAEWIRQLFRAAGMPKIPEANTMRQRSRDLRADLREGVISAFMESGPVKEAASNCGCSVHLARAILAEERIEPATDPDPSGGCFQPQNQRNSPRTITAQLWPRANSRQLTVAKNTV